MPVLGCGPRSISPPSARPAFVKRAPGRRGQVAAGESHRSEDFCRIKAGIGRPTGEDGTRVTDEDIIVGYVLGDFTPQEEKTIKPVIARVAEAVNCILAQGITAAMNKFN